MFLPRLLTPFCRWHSSFLVDSASSVTDALISQLLQSQFGRSGRVIGLHPYRAELTDSLRHPRNDVSSAAACRIAIAGTAHRTTLCAWSLRSDPGPVPTVWSPTTPSRRQRQWQWKCWHQTTSSCGAVPAHEGHPTRSARAQPVHGGSLAQHHTSQRLRCEHRL